MVLWQSIPGSSACDQQEQAGPDAPAFAEILQSARSGDSERLCLLYRQFLPAVFGYIAARTPNRETAEDLTSEVFLKMLEGIERLRSNEEAGFASWLLQIARITVAGYYRKQARQPVTQPFETLLQEEQDEQESALPPSEECCDPLNWLIVHEEWSAVVEAMNRLTEEQRQVLVARLILDYDVATVAKMLDKTVTAIKSLQFRALRRLQHLLHQQVVAHQKLHRKEEVR